MLARNRARYELTSGTSNHHARSDGYESLVPSFAKAAKVGQSRTEQFVSRIASRAEIPAQVRRFIPASGSTARFP
jgi:hypothetical protein